jgi:hypothetical protein
MGKVSRAMEARAARVQPEMNRLRGEVMKVLVQGLRESVEEQPYSCSPHRARLTGRLRRSIRPRALGNQGAGVGFDTSIAPHAPYRLKMTGPYRKTKSGDKTMTPAADIERLKGEEIRRLGFETLKRITD